MSDTQKPVGFGYWLVVAAIVLIAIALRVMLYDPWSHHHPDELIQYLEQAGRLVHDYGLVPWETRYGTRNGLIPQFLAGPMWLGEILAPGGILGIHLARGAFAALCLLGLAGAWGLGALRSHRHALVALLVAAIWYDSIFFSVALLSGSAATALIIAGAALLLGAQGRVGHPRLAGFLLVLGIMVRFQYGPFVAVVVLGAARRDFALWRQLAIGACAALVLTALSDMLNNQIPFSWLIAGFSHNMIEGRAAEFGTSGPFEYVNLLWSAYGIAGILILVLSLFSGRRYWPVLAACLLNVALHSLIGHKEYRFIWLSEFGILVLGAIGSVAAVDLLLGRWGRDSRAGWIGAAIVAAGWSVLAWITAQDGPERLPRKGGIHALASHEVSTRPEICGLAMPEKYAYMTAQVLLGRNVPIYWIPADNLGGLSPLPDELVEGANAALNDGELFSNPEYEVVTCIERDDEQMCLLVRPGGCDAAAGKPYSLQQQMLDEDM